MVNNNLARANLLIIDEFTMVDKEIVDSVLRRFLANSRHPKYLDLPEYYNLQEDNVQIYLSSAWLKFWPILQKCNIEFGRKRRNLSYIL